MAGELERMGKEVVVAYLTALSCRVVGYSLVNDEKRQVGIRNLNRVPHEY
jgi:hypothetical protein